MKKKAYTMIELLIVILIIGILFAAFRNVFQINNKDKFYGESCVNNLYGDISSYLYAAITSKAILSGTERINPDQYYIVFDTPNNSILLKHQIGGGGIMTNKEMNLGSLTGSIPSNYNCKTNSYTMMMTGDSLQLQINKGLGEDTTLRSMILGGGLSPYFTGTIKFFITYPSSTLYKEIGNFDIDIRTQSIKNKTCLQMNDSGNCTKRNQ